MKKFVLENNVAWGYVEMVAWKLQQQKINPREITEREFYETLDEYAKHYFKETNLAYDYEAMSPNQVRRLWGFFKRWQQGESPEQLAKKKRHEEMAEVIAATKKSIANAPFEETVEIRKTISELESMIGVSKR